MLYADELEDRPIPETWNKNDFLAGDHVLLQDGDEATVLAVFWKRNGTKIYAVEKNDADLYIVEPPLAKANRKVRFKNPWTGKKLKERVTALEAERERLFILLADLQRHAEIGGLDAVRDILRERVVWR